MLVLVPSTMIRFVYLLLIYSSTASQLQFDGLGPYQLLHNIHLSVPIPVDDHFDTNETILTAVAMSTSHVFGIVYPFRASSALATYHAFHYRSSDGMGCS